MSKYGRNFDTLTVNKRLLIHVGWRRKKRNRPVLALMGKPVPRDISQNDFFSRLLVERIQTKNPAACSNLNRLAFLSFCS
jgi:hypothetical protein